MQYLDRLMSELYQSLFMMKKQHDSGKTAMKWLHQIGFVLPFVHIPGLWHSLHPLSNNGSSVAVAWPVGQALHFILWLLFTWKNKSKEW